MRATGLMMIVSLGALSTAASATSDDTPATRTIEGVSRCRSITASAERLECFDKAAAALIDARDKGALVVLDRQRIVERRRARFGLAMADDAGVGGAEITEVDTTIRIARPSAAYGRWDMELANGSVWQTIDQPTWPPKAGEAIKLKKASLGGFRARVGGTSILIKRIR